MAEGKPSAAGGKAASEKIVGQLQRVWLPPAGRFAFGHLADSVFDCARGLASLRMTELTESAVPTLGNGIRFAQDGFTFVEILAALMFLALVVPAIIGAMTISNRASLMAERGAVAGELAENKLGEMLVGNTWSTASGTKGDFGADWPNYRWEITTTDWTGDATNRMTELDVDVYYPVQGKDYAVHLSTLVDPNATPAPTPSTSS